MKVSELTQALQGLPGDAEVRLSAGWLMLNISPCEKCGSTDGVKVVPTGSLARFTAICPPCLSRLEALTVAYHQGGEA